MERIEEPQRESYDQQRRAHLDILQRSLQVLRGEGPQEQRIGQGAALEFDDRDVDLACRVGALPPYGAAVPVQQDRKAGHPRQVRLVDMKDELDTVRKVPARLVVDHVAAGDEKQPAFSRKEEAARPGEQQPAPESGHLCRGQQQGFGHHGAAGDSNSQRASRPS